MTLPTPVPRTRSWVPIVAGAAAFLVVLAGIGVVVADWLSRNSEMNALVTAIEGSERAMGRTQDDLRASAGPLTGKPTESQKADVADALSSAAFAGEIRIGMAGEYVAMVPVLPWHRDIIAAKAAYVAHNLAWQDYMAKVSADPAVYGTDQPEVNDTFMASEPLLKAAVPVPALFDLTQRVDDIYTEGAAPADSQPSQEVSLRR